MVSTDLDLLYPSLAERLVFIREEWRKRYPNNYRTVVTCVHRGNDIQQILFNSGRSKAKPGQSLHNYTPACAVDIAFIDRETEKATWWFPLYQEWGVIAETTGLMWGGRFPNLVDGPHIQLPMSWSSAAAGKYPVLPPLTFNQFMPNIFRQVSIIVLEATSINESLGTRIIVIRGQGHIVNFLTPEKLYVRLPPIEQRLSTVGGVIPVDLPTTSSKLEIVVVENTMLNKIVKAKEAQDPITLKEPITATMVTADKLHIRGDRTNIVYAEEKRELLWT